MLFGSEFILADAVAQHIKDARFQFSGFGFYLGCHDHCSPSNDAGRRLPFRRHFNAFQPSLLRSVMTRRPEMATP
jgi:hypothetical protein